MNIDSCPWCGNQGKLLRCEEYGYFDYTLVRCDNEECPVQPSTKKFDNEKWNQTDGNVFIIEEATQKAIDAWNNRKDDQ